MPLDGLRPPLTLTPSAEGDESALPHCHTCFNQIVIPMYRSAEKLEEKLRYAIENAAGFHLT